MKIYVAAPYKSRRRANTVAAALRAAGHEVPCRWLQGNTELPRAVAAGNDIADLEECDALVLLTCAMFDAADGLKAQTGGCHTEFGYAIGNGHKLYILGPRINVFHYPEVVVQVDTLQELIDALGESACTNS